MLRATFKSLLSRKLRLLLSAFAVVIGVMFVSGAFVLTDALGRSFDAMFTTAYSTVDVQIVTAPRPGHDSQDTAVAARIPASLLEQARGVPGVAKATGTILIDGTTPLDPKTGKAISPAPGVPRFGGNWAGEDDLVRLTRGRPPRTGDEVVINAGLAKTGGFHLGDRIDVLVQPPKRTFTVVGVFAYTGGRDSLVGESTVLFDTPTAQDLLLGEPDTFTEIDIATEPGTSATALRDRLRQRFDARYQVKTGKELARQQGDAFKKGMRFFNYILLGFAGVALFVGVFIILNTFSIIVAQRMRELALMRAIGASRTQMLLAVLVEALAIGAIASVLGLAAGVGVGALLATVLGSMMGGLEVSAIGVPVAAVASAFGVGLLVTLIAALAPALRASRVPPVAALHESVTADRPLTRITAAGGVTTAAGILALVTGLTGAAGGGTLWTILVGVLITFVGISLLTPVFSRPVASAIGRLFAWSAPGELGRRNTARNPRRTAITAAALMVGVSLVTAISTVFSSASASIDHAMSSNMRAQLVVSGPPRAQNVPTFDRTVLDTARNNPDVGRVAGLWYDFTAGESDFSVVTATDDLPALAAVAGVHATAGTLPQLRGDQAVIDDATANGKRLGVGSSVRVQLSRADSRQFRIVGVFKRTSTTQGLAPGVVVSSDVTGDFRAQSPQIALVQVRSDARVDAVEAELNRLVADSPEVSVNDRSAFVEQQTSEFDRILVFIQILLAFAMVIAVLGVVNTLVLSVIERTRELGLLRAIGLARTQATRMIMVESTVISLFGALLGIAVGAGLGAAVVRALKPQGITSMAFPYPLMITYLVIAAVVGVVAAVAPAVRVARLNTLDAIAHE